MKDQLKNIRSKALLLLNPAPQCPEWMSTKEQSCELCYVIFPKTKIEGKCPRDVYVGVTVGRRIRNIMNEDWILIPLINKVLRK